MAKVTRMQLLARLCDLSTKVAREVYGHRHASDCFCTEEKFVLPYWTFEEEVIAFIERAVHYAIQHEKDLAAQAEEQDND